MEAEKGSEGVVGRWREPVMELKDRPVRWEENLERSTWRPLRK